ncbi:hypothetical protein ACFQ3Z_16085 [Streptomyces nogalater]
MSDPAAKASHRAAETHFVITRADGTVIDLGRGVYWHRNPSAASGGACGPARFTRRARAANRSAARAAGKEL